MSKKIPVNGLIDEFKIMRDEHWNYVFGAARKGEVDCSGAFVYVWKKFGLSIDHGSNSILRKSVKQLIPVKNTAEIKAGMAVFRVKPWTETEEDRSNRWFGSDPGNASHMGLIIQNGSKFSVIHAKGTKYGVVESNLDSSWAYAAELKDVDYSEEEKDMTFGNATITLSSGYVRLREKPGTNSKTLAKLYSGDRVVATATYGYVNWYYVYTADNLIGYVYSKYVTPDDDAVLNPEVPDFVIGTAEGIADYDIGKEKGEPGPSYVENILIVDCDGNMFEVKLPFTVLTSHDSID